MVDTKLHDDAGVYLLRPDLAIIQTLDFFTPIVDDPYAFGQIAAANALSDVYAMGGKPLTAMNIVGFPIETMDRQILKDILHGGLDKVKESGALLVGGHSVKDDEVKYGLSVTGTVHPDQLKTNRGARSGDALILTKPLGAGILATALKHKKTTGTQNQLLTATMSALNQRASEIAVKYNCHALSDVTGFGLVGHALEICDASKMDLTLQRSKLPILPGTIDFIHQSELPGGARTNREYYAKRVKFHTATEPALNWLFFDPQTSGGLLICLPQLGAEAVLNELQDSGMTAAIIGEFSAASAQKPQIQVF